jgi:hypothetical protein
LRASGKVAHRDKDREIGQIFQLALGSQEGEVPEHGGLAGARVAQHNQVVESEQGLLGGHRWAKVSDRALALAPIIFPRMPAKLPPSFVLPDLKGDVECLQAKRLVLSLSTEFILSKVEGFGHVQDSQATQLGHELLAIGGRQGLSLTFSPETLGFPTS